MIAGTDTRHYEALTESILRFIPMVLTFPEIINMLRISEPGLKEAG
jgi:hypothetical protein